MLFSFYSTLICYDDTLIIYNSIISGIVSIKTKSVGNKFKLSKLERESISLNKIQKEILIGTILGDASLERPNSTHNTRLRFDQTFPTHAPYLMYLYSKIYNLTGSGPKIYIRKPDLRTNKIYSSIAFKTYSLPCLNYYYELFYLNGTKIIPKNIAELLTPRSLAIWICDDGSKDSNNQTILHTRSYTFNEITILQEAIKFKFNLNTR